VASAGGGFGGTGVARWAKGAGLTSGASTPFRFKAEAFRLVGLGRDRGRCAMAWRRFRSKMAAPGAIRWSISISQRMELALSEACGLSSVSPDVARGATMHACSL